MSCGQNAKLCRFVGNGSSVLNGSEHAVNLPMFPWKSKALPEGRNKLCAEREAPNCRVKELGNMDKPPVSILFQPHGSIQG